MRFNLKLVFISTSILFTIGCNSDEQKVYKKFDTSNKYQEQSQSLSDSKTDGGFGFESIAQDQGWTTNLSPNISSDFLISIPRRITTKVSPFAFTGKAKA